MSDDIHHVRLSDVRPGDVLLIGPAADADPERNTVERIDGRVGVFAIIDFTDGTSTAPITTDPYVYLLRTP